jgi:hypothetical protein
MYEDKEDTCGWGDSHYGGNCKAICSEVDERKMEKFCV